MAEEEKRYVRLPRKMRGIKKRNGRKYIWLLDHEGVPHKHFLDEYGPRQSKDKGKR